MNACFIADGGVSVLEKSDRLLLVGQFVGTEAAFTGLGVVGLIVLICAVWIAFEVGRIAENKALTKKLKSFQGFR